MSFFSRNSIANSGNSPTATNQSPFPSDSPLFGAVYQCNPCPRFATFPTWSGITTSTEEQPIDINRLCIRRMAKILCNASITSLSRANRAFFSSAYLDAFIDARPTRNHASVWSGWVEISGRSRTRESWKRSQPINTRASVPRGSEDKQKRAKSRHASRRTEARYRYSMA